MICKRQYRIGMSSQLSVSSSHVQDNKEGHGIHLNPMVMVLQPQNSESGILVQANELCNSSSTVCRICHEGNPWETLISPCNCTGSLGYIHRHCLEKWLSTSNTNKCEICRYEFHIIRHPKTLWQWLTSGGTWHPKGFLSDVLCLLVLVPLSLVPVYLYGSGAHKYVKHHEWEGIGLAMLCLLLMMAVILWCCATIRFHYKMFRSWQAKNQDIRLILERENDGQELAVEVNNNNQDEEESTAVEQVISRLDMSVFDRNVSSIQGQAETNV